LESSGKHQFLYYADVNILGENIYNIIRENIKALLKESKGVGLEVNTNLSLLLYLPSRVQDKITFY
jgi:hypothetical protein